MAIDFAIAEPADDFDASPWKPMSSAPRVGPLLLRSRWAGGPVAIVGVYMPVHGAWCTQPIFGQGEQIINAEGWAELPNLAGAW
jgi:hypothetical protein